MQPAADKGPVEVIRSLLQAGASVHDSDDQGQNALLCAAEGKSVEAVRLLLQAGLRLEATDTRAATRHY